MSSNDFSLFALFTAGLAAFAQAYTTPVGDQPSGNPIYRPGLDEIVPVGQPYAITWDPTTAGTVTLVLLRGPAENIEPLYPIVEQIPNQGTYAWTPTPDLEPDTTHYGIQLIVDADGSYQYTTQFGISNPDYGVVSSSATVSSPSSSSVASSVASVASSVASVASSVASVASSVSSSASSSSASSSSVSVSSSPAVVSSSARTTTTVVVPSVSGNATAGPSPAYTTEVVTAFTTYCPGPTQLAVGNKTYTVSSATTLTVTDCPCTLTRPVISAGSSAARTTTVVVASTGYSNGVTVIQPTKSMSVPASLRTSTVTSAVGGSASSVSGAVSSVSGAVSSVSGSASSVSGAASSTLGSGASATTSRPAVATVNAAGKKGMGGVAAVVGALGLVAVL